MIGSFQTLLSNILISVYCEFIVMRIVERDSFIPVEKAYDIKLGKDRSLSSTHQNR